MKGWMFWILAVVAISLLGGRSSAGTDVAQLRPVEVVSVSLVENQVQIEIDTGDKGLGTDLQTAIRNLRDTAPAEVFLETAEYLLIGSDCEALLPELMGQLRLSCRVCRLEGEFLPEQVGQYLNIHQPATTLRQYRAGLREMEVLNVNRGRMELVS